jgi:hypothetical protein
MTAQRSRVDDILTGISTGDADLKRGVIPQPAEVIAEHVEPAYHITDASKKIEKTVDDKLASVPKPDPKKDSPIEDMPEASKTETPSADEVNDYGIVEVKKPQKMYTEEEFNARIRDRLSRVKQQPAAPEPVKEVVASTDENEPWQVEMKDFIKKTNEEERQQENNRIMRQEAEREQLEFQDKFDRGVSKYQDFSDVTYGKSITQAMMIATKELENPADFIYAACKLYPDEVSRIASITNPLKQLVEVGKLDERMRKSTKATSAPRPLGRITSDGGEIVPEQKKSTNDLEDRIKQHAAKKHGRK